MDVEMRCEEIGLTLGSLLNDEATAAWRFLPMWNCLVNDLWVVPTTFMLRASFSLVPERVVI